MGVLLGGSYKKDSNMSGSILRSSYLGNHYHVSG